MGKDKMVSQVESSSISLLTSVVEITTLVLTSRTPCQRLIKNCWIFSTLVKVNSKQESVRMQERQRRRLPISCTSLLSKELFVTHTRLLNSREERRKRPKEPFSLLQFYQESMPLMQMLPKPFTIA